MPEQQEFTISLFQSVGDTRPQMTQRTWAQLCDKFARPVIRQEKDGLLFSPAKYRALRRLIANVIELSLLVLEIDGAWQCDGPVDGGGLLSNEPCGYKAPLTIFRNKRRAEDKCPKCKREVKISQIHFDLNLLKLAVRTALPPPLEERHTMWLRTAFAIYSTHSHLRSTYSNTLAEPRYRIVVPLTEPIPVNRYLELWQWAVDGLQTIIPADPQVKDPNRIYYTPVKFSAQSPYEYHIEPGEFLNWRKLLESKYEAQTHHAQQANEVAGFRWHEDRHAELCERIKARGKPNTRGHYDAPCLAHGSKGKTALVYFPRSGAVTCNKGCSYFALLVGEGLPDGTLPSSERARKEELRSTATSGGMRSVPPALAGGSPVAPQRTAPLNANDLHNIYSTMLAYGFELKASDEAAIRKHWGRDPYTNIPALPVYPDVYAGDEPAMIKTCSMPSPLDAVRVTNILAELFDLSSVPGFYTDPGVSGEPSAQAGYRQWLTKEFGIWRINLPAFKAGLLVPYDNGGGYILGVRIYRNVRDTWPTLLTSRSLPGGGKAVQFREAVAA